MSLQEAILPFIQATCLRIMGNLVKPVNSKSMSILPHFIYCELSSLIRNNAVQDTVAMTKTVSPQMVVSLSIICRETNPYPECQFSKKKKHTALFKIEAVLSSQPSNMQLAHHPKEWCLIRNSVFCTDGRLDTQQWL